MDSNAKTNAEMLRECKLVRQVPDEPFRRWFWDNFFDLIVWYENDGAISGFQLCYKSDLWNQRVLTWKETTGFSHDLLDDGEGRPYHYKMTPILVADGHFRKDLILDRFNTACANIEPAIAQFIAAKIQAYPQTAG